MRKILSILLITGTMAAIIAFVSCNGDDATGPSPGPTFAKAFDFEKDAGGYAVCLAPDGDIIAAGYVLVEVVDTTGTDTTSTYDLLVMKVNRSGDTVWTSTLVDTAAYESVRIIVPAIDGGYLAGCSVSDYGSRMRLQKVLPSGHFDWHEDFYFGFSCSIFDLIIGQDGYAITGVAGYRYTGPAAFVLKVDQFGGFPWEYTGSTNPGTRSYAVIELSDKSLVFAGSRIAPDQSDDIYLQQFDPSGDSLRANVINLGGDCYPRALKPAANKGLIIYGSIYIDNSSGLFTLQTDSLGNQKSVHIDFFQGEVWISKIRIRPDGNILLCGYTNYGSLDNNGYLALADKDGNLLWERQYDDPAGYIRLYDATHLAGGGYAAVGELVHADDTRDFYLIKTDASGLIADN